MVFFAPVIIYVKIMTFGVVCYCLEVCMLFYDVAKLTELADSFSTLSGIRMGLLSREAVEFFSHPKEMGHFCSLIRNNPKIDQRCVACDFRAFKNCKKAMTPITYQCHMGLTEVIAPVKEEDVIICYFMFGQVIIEEDKNQTMEYIINMIKNEKLDDPKIWDAIKRIRCISKNRIDASIKILEAILAYIFSNKLITIKKVQFLDLLNSYIDSHISKNIHVEDLCKFYGFSRTRLYELSQSYIECGLSEYILHRKIVHAQKLLKETSANIIEISEQIGFSDYNYFSRVFRKKIGISPGKYRNQ
jgi:YesN/AraC family two-component response regulator